MSSDELDREISMDFDTLKPRVHYFKFQNKRFALREASEGDKILWREAQFAAERYSDGKLIGYEGLAETSLILLAQCVKELLFDAQGNVSGEKPVSKTTIRTWPSRVGEQLFDMAKEISELNKGVPVERKSLAFCLSRPTAPVSLSKLREYVFELAKSSPDAKPFADMLEALDPVAGGVAKNEPSDTGSSSS